MKGFNRKNQLLSLCGLNCGLCPMLLGNYCGGCGNGNQSCKIAKCSLEHGKIEYCYECEQYPCEKHQHIDEYDIFITSRRKKADLERAQSIGIEQYNREQREKVQILSYLLEQIRSNNELSSLPFKEQCLYVAGVFQKIADRRNVKLKLIKKK